MHMDWPYILTVLCTGLIVVFIGLIFLILFVSLLGKIINLRIKSKEKKQFGSNDNKPVSNTKSDIPPSAIPIIENGIDDEIIAVITAAVAAMSDENGKSYAIRGIKKAKTGRPVWASAGLQENTRAF